MDAKYDLKTWAEQTKTGRSLFIMNHLWTPAELPGWQLREALPALELSKWNTVREYIWTQGDKDATIIRIDVHECASWKDAHQHLLDRLAETMAMEIPTAASGGLAIGDVAYGSGGENATQLWFTRGNVLVELTNIGTEVQSVAGAAQAIDRFLLDQKVASKEGVLPTIRSLKANGQAIAGQRLGLQLEADDPLDRTVMVLFSASSGSFQRDGEGVSFIPDSSEAVTIDVAVINENDFVSTSAITLEASE